jgi:hypothetical protein
MNVYEVTYKNSAKARVSTAIRFAKSIDEKALIIDDEVVLSIRLVGEYAGEFCQTVQFNTGTHVPPPHPISPEQLMSPQAQEILKTITEKAGDGSCPQGFELFPSSVALCNEDLHKNYT